LFLKVLAWDLKKIVKISSKNIIFEVFGTERGKTEFFLKDSFFQGRKQILAKFHVSSINIRRENFFDLLTPPYGWVSHIGTPK
jgi:hypothetical protein